MGLSINEVHHGDASSLLSCVERESIALSLWSPPYFVGKEYEKHLTYESWLQLLKRVVEHHTALLKPGGFMVVNIADILCFPDETLPRFQAENLRRRRSDITREMVLEAKVKFPHYNRNQLAAYLGCSEQTIDRRLNGNNIRGGKYATQTRVHLIGGLLEKYAYDAGLPLYDRRVWIKDASWENSRWTSLSYRAVDEFEYLYFFWKPGATVVDRSRLTPEEWTEWGSRATWKFPSVRANNDHEAKFPLELPRRVLRLLTQPGDVVLDPFMGSGTTGLAAIELDRGYIGIELEEQYVNMANSACDKARKAKTARNNGGVFASSQLSLLSLSEVNGP